MPVRAWLEHHQRRQLPHWKKILPLAFVLLQPEASHRMVAMSGSLVGLVVVDD